MVRGLRETWQTKARPDLFFAGQISGVEGYVESAASGLIAGRNAAAIVLGREPRVPPRTTAIGALRTTCRTPTLTHYQPTNITFGIIASSDSGSRRAKDRKLAVSQHALRALEGWIDEAPRRQLA